MALSHRQAQRRVRPGGVSLISYNVCFEAPIIPKGETKGRDSVGADVSLSQIAKFIGNFREDYAPEIMTLPYAGDGP